MHHGILHTDVHLPTPTLTHWAVMATHLLRRLQWLVDVREELIMFVQTGATASMVVGRREHPTETHPEVTITMLEPLAGPMIDGVTVKT